MKTFDLSLYLIADPSMSGPYSLNEIVSRSLEGGATIIQMRAKHQTTRLMIETAKLLLEITRQFHVPLIINDRIDVALAVDADGVHLGDDDMPIESARSLLGSDKIIGLSAHTVEEARSAESRGANYLGVGTVFPTSTKTNIKGVIGSEGLKQICSSVAIPCVAIGGINESNAAVLKNSGAKGIAVISALMGSGDPQSTAKILRNILNT
ncbi:thiamine phosphate synthase [bacterium]|nr:thiamine phosphate synthase [bacterium]